jgi:hypothetical protein
MGGACGAYKVKEKFEQGCVGNPDGKMPLGRPGCRWEDNKVDLKEGVDWMDVAQDRDKWRAVVKSVIYFRVPSSAGTVLTK